MAGIIKKIHVHMYTWFYLYFHIGIRKNKGKLVQGSQLEICRSLLNLPEASQRKNTYSKHNSKPVLNGNKIVISA